MDADLTLQKVPGGIRVLSAPERTSIGLQVLAEACSHELKVYRDLVTIADQVVYRVTGWRACALDLVLVEDRRSGEAP
jgi:hypothetical protein